MQNKEETKQLLKDWMTSTCQLAKAENHNRTSDDIAAWFRINFGIKQRSKWVEKALYGKKSAS